MDPNSLQVFTGVLVKDCRRNTVRNFRCASLIAVLMASARSSPAQARADQGGPVLSAPDNTLKFDVVSVKLSVASANSLEHRQLQAVDPGRVRCVNVGLKDLILNTYNLKAYQVAGPDWLNDIVVNIDATMPPSTTKEQMRVVFQNMLAERFKLISHWDTRDLPTYSIVIARNGPKMRESIEVPSSGNDMPPPPPAGPAKLDTDGFPISTGPQRDGTGTNMINGSRLRGKRATMQDLANEVSKMQLQYPVTDDTGLKARYDFTLKFATPGWNGELEEIPQLGIFASAYEKMEPLPDLGTSLQSQLGLRLQPKKAPVEVFIIDHVERLPTGN